MTRLSPVPAPLARACLLACLSTAWLPAAWAQQEVVVTGSARAQKVLDAPFAISVVGSEALRNAGPMVNLSEVMAQVPGLVVNHRNNYAQDLQISSRGFGARAPFGVRGLRLYTDGIPATMPDGQGQVAHFDLGAAQRIEVLRGPFSVLYGSNSGGVIALFTAPVQAAQSEVALDAGSFGLRQGRVGVATPLGPVAGGTLDLRASVSSMELDGFRPQSAAERQLANVRLGWQAARDSVVVQLSRHQQDAQDPLGLTRADFLADPRRGYAFTGAGFNPATYNGSDTTTMRFDTRKAITQSQAGLNWRHRFADTGVLRESSLTLYDGLRSVTQWQAIPPNTQANARHGGGVVDFDRRYGGVEGKLGLRLGEADVAVGLNVEHQQDLRRGYENFLGTAAAPTAMGVTGKQRRDETNRATTTEGFVQAVAPLAPQLELTGGLRGGRVAMSTHDRYIVGANVDDSGERAFNYLNPALGLRWSLSPEWALHASAARGYETPTLGELAYRLSGGGFNPDLKAQSSRQFELGAKRRSAVFDLDATLFAIDTRDEIGVMTNSGGRSVFQNVGRTRRWGGELAAGWRPAAGLKLQAAASLLHAAYRDAFTTCVATPCNTTATPAVGTALVPAGNRIAGTQRASAWAQAAWTPGAALPGEFALEWRAVAATAANDLNSEFAPGYALVNLRWSGKLALGERDALELLARVDNLLDRAYAGSVIVNDGNSRFYEPGAPRNVLLSLRWQHRW